MLVAQLDQVPKYRDSGDLREVFDLRYICFIEVFDGKKENANDYECEV